MRWTKPCLTALCVFAATSCSKSEAKKLADRNYQLTLTGPWPAYTFVADPEPT